MQSGENLARLRKLRGLSQQEVAEELDVTRQSISQWEAGRTFPSMQKQIALSQLYGVPLEELYPEETTKKEEAETDGMPEEPEPEKPDSVPPAMEVTQEEQPQQEKRRGRWFVPILVVICAAIYIWGQLTHSSGAAFLMILLLIGGLFAISVLRIFCEIVSYVIDYFRRKKL